MEGAVRGVRVVVAVRRVVVVVTVRRVVVTTGPRAIEMILVMVLERRRGAGCALWNSLKTVLFKQS